MKNSRLLISIVLCVAVLASLGVYLSMKQKPSGEQNPTVEQPVVEIPDALTYAVDESKVSVEKTMFPSDYTAGFFAARAGDCGTEHDAEYFKGLANRFGGSSKIVYVFTYLGESQEKGKTYTVTVLENKAGYETLEQFKADFDLCSAGGKEYPKMVSKDWLLLEDSCGSGFAEESDLSKGCDVIRDSIESSLELK